MKTTTITIVNVKSRKLLKLESIITFKVHDVEFFVDEVISEDKVRVRRISNGSPVDYADIFTGSKVLMSRIIKRKAVKFQLQDEITYKQSNDTIAARKSFYMHKEEMEFASFTSDNVKKVVKKLTAKNIIGQSAIKNIKDIGSISDYIASKKTAIINNRGNYGHKFLDKKVIPNVAAQDTG